MRLALAAAGLALVAGNALAAFSPPAHLTVVSDEGYPPYLFRGEDGQLRGILKDKWELWARKNGVAITIKGSEWAKAQSSVLSGDADVIDALSHSESRAKLYAFSPPWGTFETRIFFHRSISGINDARSMRGFAVGTKEGSTCNEWLQERGVQMLRRYPDFAAMVQAAGTGEIRLFCMDLQGAQYYFHKLHSASEFRQTAPLYEGQYYWAVARSKAALRDFIQRGFERISAAELQEIDRRWLGNPLELPIDPRYFYYFAITVAAMLAAAALLLLWNRSLRERVIARTARLRQMTKWLTEVEEAERRNINRELHDRVGQNLSALQLSLGTLRMELDRSAAPTVHARLDDAQSLLEVTSHQVRDVMAELRPAALDDYGLFAAVRHHSAAVAARVRIPITVEGGEIESSLPPAAETALFRIVQEALHNAAKHARAHNVKVILASTLARVRLSVVDDGCGFDAAHPAQGASYGVTTMHERAEAVGARLRIDSSPGKGTRVDIEVDRSSE